MEPTVTIAKPYFDALLRRAEFDVPPNASSAGHGTITVTLEEYGYLKQAAKEYAILRKALLNGGLAQTAMDTILSEGLKDGEEAPSDYQPWESAFTQDSVPPTNIPNLTLQGPTRGSGEMGSKLTGNVGQRRDSYRKGTRNGNEAESRTEDHWDMDPAEMYKPAFPRVDKRTIVLSGLSDKTTHADLTSIVRGGRLLDVHVRNDRTAAISFVEGASEFFAYAKRHDIYIHAKRVEVRWAERQFHMPAHVSQKISSAGATRNLVVRGGARPKLTEEKIREDLDHIHNLVVISVNFEKGDAFISLNSIHNSLFARTCMMSRTAYKGLKIDYYPDECAAPVPKPPAPVYNAAVAKPKKAGPAPNRNVYSVLAMDSQDSDEETEKMEDVPKFTAPMGWIDGVFAT